MALPIPLAMFVLWLHAAIGAWTGLLIVLTASLALAWLFGLACGFAREPSNQSLATPQLRDDVVVHVTH
jgi:hypothetical protein